MIIYKDQELLNQINTCSRFIIPNYNLQKAILKIKINKMKNNKK